MSDAMQAIQVIQSHECDPRCTKGIDSTHCYVDDPNDLGGVTKHGISLRFCLDTLAKMPVELSFPKPTTPEEIKALTRLQAAEIYLQCWWNQEHYERIAQQLSATKICDMAVNMGPYKAHICAQLAANDCGASLLTDGQIGPKSVAAINAIPDNVFVRALALRQKERYESIIGHNPSQAVWLHNWLVRASWPVDQVGKLWLA